METCSPLKTLQRFESSKRIGTSCFYPNTAGFSGNLLLAGILGGFKMLILDCFDFFFK